MTTAPASHPASAPASAPNRGPAIVKIDRMGTESIAAYFERVLAANAVPDDGSAGERVVIFSSHPSNPSLPNRIHTERSWAEFDDSTLSLPPGYYVVQLKTMATKRGALASVPYKVDGLAPVSTVQPQQFVNPGMPPVAAPSAGTAGGMPSSFATTPIDPNAMVAMLFKSVADQNALMMQRLMQPKEPTPPRDMIAEMGSMLEFTKKLAGKVSDTGGGSAIAEAIRDCVPMVISSLSPLLNRLGQRPVQSVALQPAAPQLASSPAASSAALPAATAPAPDPDPFAAAIDQAVPLLRLGASIDGEPSLYAQVLLDGFKAVGMEVEGALGAIDPGLLARAIAERSGLSLAWLTRVEDALRAPDDDEDEEGEDNDEDRNEPGEFNGPGGTPTRAEIDRATSPSQSAPPAPLPFQSAPPAPPPFVPNVPSPSPAMTDLQKPARKPRARKDRS